MDDIIKNFNEIDLLIKSYIIKCMGKNKNNLIKKQKGRDILFKQLQQLNININDAKYFKEKNNYKEKIDYFYIVINYVCNL